MAPVGEGAMRVTTGLSAADGEDIGLPGLEASSASADAPAWGWARGLNTRPLRFPSWTDIWAWARDEVTAQADRAFLWTPVAFGVGAAAYLGVRTEPPLWLCVAAAVLAVLVAAGVGRWGRSRGLAIAASLAAVMICGFCAGKLRTEMTAAPIVPAGIGVVPLDGWVVDVASPSDHGERLLIAPTSIAGLSAARTPKRVRIVVPQGDVLGPGSAIHVMALLDPPPGPAAPGSYDFARDAWFDGLGGVGLAMKPPQLVDLEPPPWRLRMGMAVNSLRWSLAQHLASDLRRLMGDHDGGAVGLVVTVATSHEDWLDPQSRDDLRGSGLAHMLAIAGLHTAAVSGFVFFALRLGVAAWPWLALRVNGKKVAAIGGLIAVLIYLTLSGAHPPARRAAMTASVAFIAILLDRRAVSLHSLAIAALAILVIEPEVVISPGFEMSFCATASLVALAEIWPVRHRAADLPWYLAALQTARDWTIGMLMVSFVAGAATTPFSIQHFNRVANYGMFANLTADLLAGMVLMPALTVGVLLQALGVSHALIAPLLALAGAAARGIVAIGHLFSNLPGAKLTVSSAPIIALIISYLGIVFACLWRGRLRWIGVPLSCAVAFWPRPAPPVAWIASDGGDAALAIAGKVVALKPNTRAYAVQTWAQRRGFDLPADPVKAQAAFADCNRVHCTPIGTARPAIAAWWTRRKPNADALADLCKGADILILKADVIPPDACKRAIVLGPDAFAKGGAAEVFPGGGSRGGWTLVWSQPLRGERPWTQASVGRD
jgi:competence protein ComEC